MKKSRFTGSQIVAVLKEGEAGGSCRNNDRWGKVPVTTTLLWPTMMKSATPRAGIAKVLKRLHYPLDAILLCVRWYVAYFVSLRNLEEMMAERAIGVDGIVNLSRPAHKDGRRSTFSESVGGILGDFCEFTPCNKPSSELAAVK